MNSAAKFSTESKRAWPRTAAALLMTTCLIGPATAQAPEKPASLTVNVFSGVFEACFKEAVVPSFEAETGITLKLVTTQPPVAKLQAQGDAPEIDVLVAGQSDMRAAHDLGVLADMARRC